MPMCPAKADFRLCNRAAGPIILAFGYKDSQGLGTHGWWSINPSACITLLRGALLDRYYYIYVIDHDDRTNWSGPVYMCTQNKKFAIYGTDNCSARGYDRTGFIQIDTGRAASWTVQLTGNH
jgi:uncharacterized membrane protein